MPGKPAKLWQAAAAVGVSANVTLPRKFAAKVDEMLTRGTALVITSESFGLRNTSGTSSLIMAPDALPTRKKACIAKHC